MSSRYLRIHRNKKICLHEYVFQQKRIMKKIYNKNTSTNEKYTLHCGYLFEKFWKSQENVISSVLF